MLTVKRPNQAQLLKLVAAAPETFAGNASHASTLAPADHRQQLTIDLLQGALAVLARLRLRIIGSRTLEAF